MTRFPDRFLWGAATSAHQVEGNNVANHYWEWEQDPHGPFTERSGDACDHYHRWPADLDLLADAGYGAYRFSLEWSRIEPEEGQVSRAALDHYRRMIDGCHERGLAPLVTLVHFTMPRWTHHDGGWHGPRAGDRIARFAETVLPILGDVSSVATVNEPNLMACMPVLAAMAARGEPVSGLPRPDQATAEALLGLHRRAAEVLRAGPAPVGMTLVGQEFIAQDGAREQAEAHRAAMEDQFLEVAKEDDFLGLQVYSCARIGPDGPVGGAPELTTLAHMEDRPQALGAAVRRAHEVLGGSVPLVITENGIATTDDDRRIAFTAEALRSLAAAIDDGVDVRGYVHWSLLDNFEWFSGYRPTFGLIAVDRTTFVRSPKPSFGWLGEVARTRTLPSTVAPEA